MDLNVGEQKVLVYVLQRKWTDANKKPLRSTVDKEQVEKKPEVCTRTTKT